MDAGELWRYDQPFRQIFSGQMSFAFKKYDGGGFILQASILSRTSDLISAGGLPTRQKPDRIFFELRNRGDWALYYKT